MENINSVVEGPLDQIGEILSEGKLNLKNIRVEVTRFVTMRNKLSVEQLTVLETLKSKS